VVIGGEQVLGDDGIGEALVAGRDAKTLLQGREGQGLAALGLLQEEGEHQLKGGHPHGHIQGLHHEAGCGITVTASEQVLPEVPPARIGEQLALIAAMEQGAGLGPQVSDDNLVERPST
jgi:hypothetical protein